MSDHPLVKIVKKSNTGAFHREPVEIIDDQSHCRCTPNLDGTYDSTNCYVSEDWFLIYGT